MRSVNAAVTTFCLLALFSSSASAAVWYVDKDAPPGGDGTSWTAAFQTIEPAVNAAEDDGGGEVWIAEGVYDEERSGGQGVLEVPADVAIYGGFIGNETAREQRDWEANECVISGEFAWAGEKAKRVVALQDANAMLDGVSVTRGQNGVTAYTNTAISNCSVYGNVGGAYGRGTGIAAYLATVENCTVYDNTGAGISVGKSQVLGCRVSGNGTSSVYESTVQDTEFSNCAESAVSVWAGDSICHFKSCVFKNNRSINGGAVYFDDQGDCSSPARLTVVFSNCIFANNQALINPEAYAPEKTGIGGAVYAYSMIHPHWNEYEGPGVDEYDTLVPPIFINCTFTGNRAEGKGGALYWIDETPDYIRSAEVEPTINANCIFWDNGPEPIAGDYTRPANFTHCIIEGGGPGAASINKNPLFRDAANGDYRLLPSSPAIDFGRDTSGGEYGEVTLDFLGCPRGHDGRADGAVTADGSDYDIGAYEYVPECSGDGLGGHSADLDQDNVLDMGELLRVVQFFNSAGFHCADPPESTEDGYARGPGDQSCTPHTSDYNPDGTASWTIDLTELLRAIQFFNTGGYHACPGANTEDGFCVGGP